MQSATEALDAARRHQQAGRRDEAIAAYCQVVSADAGNLQALYQLGVLHLELARNAEAVKWLEQALRNDNSQPAINITLGEAYRRVGDLSRACQCNRDAIRIRPDFAPAMSNLGLLLWQQGDVNEATEWLQKRAQTTPNDPVAWMMLGDVLSARQQFGEAEACFSRAVELAPDDAGARHRRATARQSLGKYAEALDDYRMVVAAQPQDVSSLVNLAACLQRLGDFEQAEINYRQALAIDPSFAPAHGNLATLLVELHRCDEAIEHSRRAIDLRPDVAEAYINLAHALQALGRLDEAIDACRRGIAQSPDVSQLHCNLGFSLREIGLIDEALAAFREAVRLDPNDPDPHSNLVYTLNYVDGLPPQEVFAEHKLWASRHAELLTTAAPPHANDRDPCRPIRIGYVSAHFRGHAVNFFVEPILASHNHDEYEVFCYSNVSPADCDATTGRLRGFADHWRDIAPLDDDAAARQVRQDRIDILVDLSGHIAGNRLGVFARRPAPVQATYIGYQNTTGMSAVDYRLTDEWSDPPGATDAFYCEQLERLPHSFFCYLPIESPPLSSLPARANGFVTFASFNHFAKVTPKVLQTWSEILAAVPRSRFIMMTPTSHSVHERVAESFRLRGVDPNRIELVSRSPYSQYLHSVARADLALDPFSFNGHTTTCDSLWMGVPVVSLAGHTYASRFGSSALATLGLTDLIADSVERYVELAVELATNMDRLAALRQSLRQQMASSPLCDYSAFTANLERAYRQMWRGWCER